MKDAFKLEKQLTKASKGLLRFIIEYYSSLKGFWPKLGSK
jgi:hypothetical protein